MDIVEQLRNGRLDPPLRSYNELHNAAANEIERLRAAHLAQLSEIEDLRRQLERAEQNAIF